MEPSDIHMYLECSFEIKPQMTSQKPVFYRLGTDSQTLEEAIAGQKRDGET